MSKNSGLELWERAKRVIPGGNMLLSKDQSSFYRESGQLILRRP